MDQFAQIAANGIGGRQELLENPAPIPHDRIVCQLHRTEDAPVAVQRHMASPEGL